MQTLRRQIRRAQRRLVLQSLAGKLARCWFVALALATTAIGAGKLWGAFDDFAWSLGCVGGGLAVATFVALAWTWIRRPTALEAATEIDRRFALKERVSSAFVLDRWQFESPIGQALVGDARRRLERIDVAERFRLRVDRPRALALVPAAAACVLAVLVGGRAAQSPRVPDRQEPVRIKKPAEALAKKLRDQRREAADKGLQEADLVLARLEAAAKNLAETSPDRKLSLVALNDLASEAQRRRKQLAGGDALKQQLARLKNLEQGPAERLGRALKNGDVQEALGELDRMKQQLAIDQLDPQARAALARQLEQIGETLARQALAQAQAQRGLDEQIAGQRRAGNAAAAERLEQQLQRVAQQSPQMDKLGHLAQQLGQTAAAVKRGEAKRASQALGQLGQQLEAMRQEDEELEMLDSALAQVADCKSALACRECDGDGCAACQHNALKLGNSSSRALPPGRGIGAGLPPDAKPDAKFYDSRVKPELGRGPSVVIGQAEGPNRKGQVQEQIKLEFSAAEQHAADALGNQRLPRDYRDHAKRYFDALREAER